ncbi:MAG: 50S ribosomal protein L10 [Planctomycetota bacterium]|nr:50S ribosomal protein L10 [Planctomycetota bacterium]
MSKVMRQRMSAEYEKMWTGVRDCAVVGFKNIGATQATELRLTLRDSGLKMHLVRNSGAQHAVRKLAWADVERLFIGPSAIVSGTGDPCQMAKVLLGWADKHKNIEVRGGLLQGSPIGPEKIRDLAGLPPRKVLMGMVVSAFSAPLAKCVGAHAAVLSKLARCFSAVVEHRGKSENVQKSAS